MRGHTARPGSLVQSRAGRDKGRIFMVLYEEGDNYVYLSDGDTRRTQKPKRKKRMHINVLPQDAGEVSHKLTKGLRVEDFEIRSAIKAASAGKKEGTSCPSRML